MKKRELINNIAKRTKFSKYTCEKITDAFVREIKECLVRGDKIRIKNFASFETVELKERPGRDPITGEVIMFPPVKTVKCKISQSVKDDINQR